MHLFKSITIPYLAIIFPFVLYNISPLTPPSPPGGEGKGEGDNL
jgi:hypothetical protein